jgi:5'-nucleotidase/UDP-sugar diphosphatase
MFSRILGSTAILAGLSMAAPVAAETTLHILHINDLHSRIQPINRFDSTCPAEDDAAGECFGGVARVATAINTLRDELTAAGENVIVLDAGDQFQGSLMYTTYKGDVEAEFMQAIGFDAMAVGNHEFDDGPDNFIRFLQVVDFPVLSGNLDLSQNDALDAEVEDTIVLDVNGVQVGIVSALATDTAETSSPGPTVIFQAEIDAIQNDVDALTEQGVDIIIALTHVGLPVDMRIAEAVTGLDVIVGGHSHTYLSATIPTGPGPTRPGSRTPMARWFRSCRPMPTRNTSAISRSPSMTRATWSMPTATRCFWTLRSRPTRRLPRASRNWPVRSRRPWPR